MKRPISLFLAFILIFSLCACASDTADDYTVSFSLDNVPVTVDPQLAESQSEIMVVTNAFEGLMRTEPDGTVTYGAAEKYTVSDNGRKYVFTLREGLKWSDETELTAQDFVYGITRALLPETDAPAADSLYCIKNAELVHNGTAEVSQLGISREGDRTVIIELDYTDPDFLRSLSLPVAMPCKEEFFLSTSGKYGLSKDDVICNGPYYVRRWSQDTSSQSLRLTRSTTYVGQAKAMPAAVLLYFNMEAKNLVTNISEDQLDSGVLERIYYRSAVTKDLKIEENEYLSWCLWLKPNGTLTSSDIIRNCLAQSIDKVTVARHLSDGFSVTDRIVLPSYIVGKHTYGSYTSSVSLSKDNVDKTKLDEIFKSELTTMAGTDSITLAFVSDSMVEQTAKSIAQCWQSYFGMKVTMKAMSENELYASMGTSAFDAAIIPVGNMSHSAKAVLSAFSSDSPANRCGYNSVEYDLILSSAKNKDEGVVAAYLLEAEKYLFEKSLLIPLVKESRFIAYDEDISGIGYLSAYGVINFSVAVNADK